MNENTTISRSIRSAVRLAKHRKTSAILGLIDQVCVHVNGSDEPPLDVLNAMVAYILSRISYDVHYVLGKAVHTCRVYYKGQGFEYSEAY